jgi:hypothetical protein
MIGGGVSVEPVTSNVVPTIPAFFNRSNTPTETIAEPVGLRLRWTVLTRWGI